MADYILRDGKGTKVREDSNLLEGYVDFNAANLQDLSPGTAEKTDYIVLQKGSADPVKATLQDLEDVIGGGGDMVYTINNLAADEDGNFSLTASSLGAAAIGHGHVISDITGLQDSLDDKAAEDHTHEEYVSGLTVDGETAHGECSLVAGNNVVLEKSGNTISIGVDSDSYVGGIAVQNISTTSNDVVETFIGTAAQWSAFTKVAGKKYLVYII